MSRRSGGRSKIWLLSHFADEARSSVQCGLCPVRIKYVGNTTNVARHLEIKHPQQFKAVCSLMPGNKAAGSIVAAAVASSSVGRSSGSDSNVADSTQGWSGETQSREEMAIMKILHQHNLEKLTSETSGGSGGGGLLIEPPSEFDCPEVVVKSEQPAWDWHEPSGTRILIFQLYKAFYFQHVEFLYQT